MYTRKSFYQIIYLFLFSGELWNLKCQSGAKKTLTIVGSITGEVPKIVIGTIKTFETSNSMEPTSLKVYRNGSRMLNGLDYTISECCPTRQFTFNDIQTGPTLPEGEIIQIDYDLFSEQP